MPGARGNINSPGAKPGAAGKLPAGDPIPARQLNLKQFENGTSSALYPDSALGEAEENPREPQPGRRGASGIGQGSKNME